MIAEWEEITEALRAETLAPKGWRKFVYGGTWRTTFAGASVRAGMAAVAWGECYDLSYVSIQHFLYDCLSLDAHLAAGVE